MDMQRWRTFAGHNRPLATLEAKFMIELILILQFPPRPGAASKGRSYMPLRHWEAYADVP